MILGRKWVQEVVQISAAFSDHAENRLRPRVRLEDLLLLLGVEVGLFPARRGR